MTSFVLHWFFVVFFAFSIVAFLAARMRFFSKSRTATSSPASSNQRQEVPPAVTEMLPKEDTLAPAIGLTSSTDDTSIPDSEIPPKAPRLRDVPHLAPQAKTEKERVRNQEYCEAEQQHKDDSGNSSEASTEPDQLRRDDVEIIVLARPEIPTRCAFSILVQIEAFVAGEITSTSSTKNYYESIVYAIKKGSLVGLVLESDQLKVDIPYQALTWERRSLVAIFKVEAPVAEAIAKNCLWIVVDGIAIGRIKFKIAVSAAMKQKPRDISFRGRIVPEYILGHSSVQIYSETVAQIFRSAFICYAHQDWDLISRFGETLEASGIHCDIDALKMKKLPEWWKQAEVMIKGADIIYVFWSNNAAQGTGVAKELDLIKKYRKGESSTILVKLDDNCPPAPEWLEDQENWSKRWQLFRAWFKQERRL